MMISDGFVSFGCGVGDADTFPAIPCQPRVIAARFRTNIVNNGHNGHYGHSVGFLSPWSDH